MPDLVLLDKNIARNFEICQEKKYICMYLSLDPVSCWNKTFLRGVETSRKTSHTFL